jgi:hypothetical protein
LYKPCGRCYCTAWAGKNPLLPLKNIAQIAVDSKGVHGNTTAAHSSAFTVCRNPSNHASQARPICLRT